MTLISDAGSTKTRWLFTEGENIIRQQLTPGINAAQISPADLATILKTINYEGVTHIRFYGAGCVGGETNDKIRTALYNASNCPDITVDSDIVGAAVGTLNTQRGIVCILGTGANSALWDGSKIEAKINAGGYILGDEGSGAVLGRTLISDYVKGLTPDWMTKILEEEYNLNYTTVVQKTYREPMPNRWLASFAKLLGEHKNQPYVQNLLSTAFTDFINRNICRYPDWQNLNCAFVGSIAYHFQDTLRTLCSARNIHLLTIKPEPFINTSY